jgi:hypothetical protein
LTQHDAPDGRIAVKAWFAAAAKHLELLLKAAFSPGRGRIVLQRTALGLYPRLQHVAQPLMKPHNLPGVQLAAGASRIDTRAE